MYAVSAVQMAQTKWFNLKPRVTTQGLYLWFKTKRERRIGSILLAGASVFTVVLITLIRSA